MGRFGNLVSALPFKDLKKVPGRFPLSAACGLGMFILIVLSVHGVFASQSPVFPRCAFACFFGYFWFAACTLIFEKQDINRRYIYLLSPLVMVLVFVASGFYSGMMSFYFMIIMIGTAILFVPVAPYLKKKDDLSFWLLAESYFSGLAMAGISAIIMGGGISLAYASVSMLFGVPQVSQVFAYILGFSIFVFAALYALSWIPEKFSFSAEDCKARSQTRFLVEWVFAPLTTLYLFILYAYYFKLLVTWSLPNGHLAWMTAGFGMVAVVTWVFGYPLRDDGKALFQKISAYIFPALIIPALVLLLVIGIRIHHYGVTEDRYLIVLCGLWFLFLGVGYVVKRLSLQDVLLSLMSLLIISSFGPWSITNVSAYSQISRLEAQLKQQNLLVDGRLVAAQDQLPFEVRKEISSILSYLQKTGRLKDIEYISILSVQSEGADSHSLADMAVKRMGFDLLRPYSSPENDEPGKQFRYTYFGSQEFIVVEATDIRGADFYISKVRVHKNNEKSGRINALHEYPGPSIAASFVEKGIQIDIAQDNITDHFVFDLTEMEAEMGVMDAKSTQALRKVLQTTGTKGGRAKIHITQIGGRIVNGVISYDNIEFSLHLTMPR